MMKKKIPNTHLAMIRNIILEEKGEAEKLTNFPSHICFSLSFRFAFGWRMRREIKLFQLTTFFRSLGINTK